MQGIKHFCSITEGNSPNYSSNNVKVSSEIHKYHTRQSQNNFKESIQTKIQEQLLNFKPDHSWNMLPHMIQELVKKYSKSKFLMTVKNIFLILTLQTVMLKIASLVKNQINSSCFNLV